MILSVCMVKFKVTWQCETVCMIPRLENSLLCSFKGLEKWLFWITGELNREEWFHYEIMIHDVLSFLRRVLATSNITHAQLYVLILVELWFHVLWFWTSGTKGFLQEQKTRVTRFSEEKKKQGWLAKTNDARVFPASLAWLPCFSLRSDYLFTLHFCFPLSGSKGKNFLQPVSPHCYIASCNPSLRLLPCLTNLSPEENKSAASLRNPVCDWSVACKKEAERDASPTPSIKFQFKLYIWV